MRNAAPAAAQSFRQASISADGIVLTTVITTCGTLCTASAVKRSIASNAAGPYFEWQTASYFSAVGAFRLTETVSISPRISAAVLRPVMQSASPFVLMRSA